MPAELLLESNQYSPHDHPSTMQQDIWILDEANFSPTLIDALEKGKAVFRDGVAYWLKGSGKTGIIEHLPFKKFPYTDPAELLAVAQKTAVAATAISTAVILGAMVVQTYYLASKLDRIQDTVDEISKDVHAQSILFYMEKLTDYIGHVEAARTLLKDRSVAVEMADMAQPLLVGMAAKRNQIFSFIDNVLNLASTSKDISTRHFELIINFVQMMLDIMPAGIHVEHLLCARSGRLRLSEVILIDATERFNAAQEVFRKFMNNLHREFLAGKIGDRKQVYQSIEQKAMLLFKSEINRGLLAPPDGLRRIELA